MQDKGQLNLKLIQKCPVCNADYIDNRIEVIDENDRSFLAYLSCGFCFSNIIVRVITMPHGLVGNAILTDLGPIEVLEYAQTENIKGDNVLEAHTLISQDSNFIEKLKQS